MKNIIFIIFFLATQTIYSQGKITARYQHICDDISAIHIKTSLFKSQNGTTQLIGESYENPAVFENLESDGFYTLEPYASGNGERRYGTRDIIMAQYHILGLKPLKDHAIYAGDANSDRKLSASDLAVMKKTILGLENNEISDQFIIFNDYKDSLNLNLDNISTIYINGASERDREINLQVVRKARIADASGLYCNNACPDITNKFVQILFDDIAVQKDQVVSFPLYLKNTLNYQGLEYKFYTKNAEIIDVKDPQYFGFNKIQNQVHATWINQHVLQTAEPSINLIQLTIKPKSDGKLSDFLFIDTDYKNNEAVVLQDGCLKIVKNVILIPSENFNYDCNIQWPADITIANCGDHSGEPSMDNICSNITSVRYTDVYLDYCKVIERNWVLTNWAINEEFTHLQLITVNENFDHRCVQSYHIELDGESENLHARDLVVDPVPANLYSFSQDDESDSIRLIRYEAPFSTKFIVYDINNNQICIAKLEKSQTELVELSFNQLITVFEQNESFTVRALDFSKNGDLLPTGISDLQISYLGQNYVTEMNFDKSYEGKTLKFTLRYRVNGTVKIIDNLSAYLDTGTFLNDYGPLKLYAYNDYLQGGKDYFIEVYSSNFENILSLQYGVKFKNVILAAVENGAIQVTSSYNYVPDENIMRMLWYEVTSVPKSINSNTVLFRLKIVPEISGFLSEFIFMDDNVLLPEAVYEGSNVSGKILLEIGFPGRTSTNGFEIKDMNFEVYPNPVTGEELYIHCTKNFTPTDLKLTDISGKEWPYFSSWQPNENTISITLNKSLPRGLYIISMTDKIRTFSKKIAITE